MGVFEIPAPKGIRKPLIRTLKYQYNLMADGFPALKFMSLVRYTWDECHRKPSAGIKL